MHDERMSDVWALGVTFFEIATGRTPFEHDDEQVREKRKGEELHLDKQVDMLLSFLSFLAKNNWKSTINGLSHQSGLALGLYLEL